MLFLVEIGMLGEGTVISISVDEPYIYLGNVSYESKLKFLFLYMRGERLHLQNVKRN
jgi:hypothetical protein